jgi:hypothetical protein
MTAVIPGKGELSMLYASLIVKILSVGNMTVTRANGCARRF